MAAVGATVAQAEPMTSPCVIENVTVQFVSPNGKYMVSNPYEDLSIIDLETGQRWDYSAYDENYESTGFSYRVGVGNIISNTGVVLASTLYDCNAAYWKNGEWHDLHSEGCKGVGLANGVTPDGSRICGSLNLDLAEFTSETMQIPVYWDAEGDGYGAYHVLPCPTLDFTGRAPIYITAVTISADGKTIAGQVQDYSGAFNEPIFYVQDADGNWSYSMPLNKVYRPEGKEWPKYPDDLPDRPDAEDYMTDTQKAEYQQALSDWYASGYDPTLYPEPTDYLSDEAKAEYNEASDEWDALAAVYNSELNAFTEVFEPFAATLPFFEYNTWTITADGTKVGANLIESDIPTPENPWPEEWTYPVRFDVATGEYQKIGQIKNLIVWSVLDDGRITASNSLMENVLTGYIENEQGQMVPIDEYISTLRPDYGTWIKENMTHEVEVDYDPDTYEPIYGEKLISGAPVMTPDGSKILTWATNTWDMEEGAPMYYGYYFDMKAGSGVGNTVADSAKAEVESYEIYDVNGRLLMQTADKAAITNLAKGVYLVKAILSNGESATEKIAF